jgi:sec-independent protein translocase protein TatB
VPSLGPLEILVIFVIALLVFGPNKLPEIARQVGKGMAEFRRVQHHLRRELDDAVHSVMDEDRPAAAAAVERGEVVDAAGDTADTPGPPAPPDAALAAPVEPAEAPESPLAPPLAEEQPPARPADPAHPDTP